MCVNDLIHFFYFFSVFYDLIKCTFYLVLFGFVFSKTFFFGILYSIFTSQSQFFILHVMVNGYFSFGIEGSRYIVFFSTIDLFDQLSHFFQIVLIRNRFLFSTFNQFLQENRHFAEIFRIQKMFFYNLASYVVFNGFGNCFFIALRSEERRVGKECRSRWSPGG